MSEPKLGDTTAGKMKKPTCDSAAGVARTVSRLLKAKGFKVSKSIDKYTSTEGFVVHRVGYSREVSISYYHPDLFGCYIPENARWVEAKEKKMRLMSEAKKYLEELGYEFNKIDWIACKRS